MKAVDKCGTCVTNYVVSSDELKCVKCEAENCIKCDNTTGKNCSKCVEGYGLESSESEENAICVKC